MPHRECRVAPQLNAVFSCFSAEVHVLAYLGLFRSQEEPGLRYPLENVQVDEQASGSQYVLREDSLGNRLVSDAEYRRPGLHPLVVQSSDDILPVGHELWEDIGLKLHIRIDKEQVRVSLLDRLLGNLLAIEMHVAAFGIDESEVWIGFVELDQSLYSAHTHLPRTRYADRYFHFFFFLPFFFTTYFMLVRVLVMARVRLVPGVPSKIQAD